MNGDPIAPFAPRFTVREEADAALAVIESIEVAGTRWIVETTTARDGSSVTVFIRNSQWPDLIYERFTAPTAREAMEMAFDWAVPAEG